MKLTALRIHGFKSFADRTEIAFHEGITAVVGPNGCGKSNISDAIRWVLGEQRPTAIRGARMEEAIFQGTVGRRPVHRGSVTMELSNAGGALPVPFEEVEIARTVFRDGGSEYRLNRSSCRLKDIQELCRDTGLGANAYAVIENRMIDAILSDRAEERRGLFEEAAGIGKYKDRRRAASRRLERAEADLQRLEDLIGEVESKVRSLARQRGRAQRYTELRKRRLDLEVTLVGRELAALEQRRSEIAGALTSADDPEALQARVTELEARLESLRATRVEAERARTEAAGRTEELRTRIVRLEREVAVAREREENTGQRLERIALERQEAGHALERADAEIREVRAGEVTRGRALQALRDELKLRRAASQEVRERLTLARGAFESIEQRERELARRTAQLRGDVDAAAEQARDLELRRQHLDEELERAAVALEELAAQGDLFTDRIAQLSTGVETTQKAVEGASREVERVRTKADGARRVELEAEDQAATLETRLRALERMERDREGMDPVLKSLLAAPPPGVLGVLADYLSAPPQVMAAVEAYLGVLSRGVLVEDEAAALRLVHWFEREWRKGGGLVILPLEGVPDLSGEGALLDRLEVEGAGAPWVRVLLDGVDFSEGMGDPLTLPAADESVTARGLVRSRPGLLRVGNPLGATGLLERRGELDQLRRDASQARDEADDARERREAVHLQVQEAEATLHEIRREARLSQDRLREAQAEAREQSADRARRERAREEVQRQIQATAAAMQRTDERAAAARTELEGLAAGETDIARGRDEARRLLEEVQEEWETVRTQVSDLTVREARAEGDVERLRERLDELTRLAQRNRRRIESLDGEEASLRKGVGEAAVTRSQGEAEIERLFSLRDDATETLRRQEEVLRAIQGEVETAETRSREARVRERQASEARHRLELESRELEGRIGRVQDRLEGEWGRSLEQLTRDAHILEGETNELRDELADVVGRLGKMGPVNMLAVEEHEEESARLDFLKEQRDDLVDARNDLRSAIREINATATRLFQETFEAIRDNFRSTFLRLFQGGECDIWLEDPQDPLESVIEIHASPRGKRTQRIDLLSGGERALTALSLLFGIYLVKPSPFCVLDEVDAPLDESNIGRFIRLLQDFKAQTQFIVITHNPRTIEAADWIYGVTMEEPGVSSIVGVRLEEALEAAGAVM
ncbi:MAG: chromosome segregation protein SMC [Gemmatimonadales bacterium]|nr:MAG: chromosome segregation protein SMC [Gemmatimonadales bacterium]